MTLSPGLTMTAWNVRARLEPTKGCAIAPLPHVPPPSGHSLVVESTTGVVACGESWCDGRCWLPTLVLEDEGREYRVFGAQVACGAVLQPPRTTWLGLRVGITLGTSTPEQAFRLKWW